MSHEALRVATSHVRALAAKHSQAAEELGAATQRVNGVHTRVRTTHGAVAWAFADAVEALEQARSTAARAIAERSCTLSDALGSAAVRYRTTDESSASNLNKPVNPDRIPFARRPR
ncbi:ESX-1 secretion-associated protein [Mycolicibacterium duvalii]|uniref:ESX-1 secretion-associated protein n=1 Tax=Mycolicibacterium duvalii TaxID=39688 RepID=A0A7I7K5F3_9MYCO|nr:ESX-1 secretion-associated protein [Mycolicibacterium duvalii]MCV7370700.1 ESX-1 secretion-associated protein [Mycolicibacterium duvalii]BBX19346.1 hypothetical protein MDUV_42060 [Mycolicibacterium duvalii]